MSVWRLYLLFDLNDVTRSEVRMLFAHLTKFVIQTYHKLVLCGVCVCVCHTLYSTFPRSDSRK